MKWTEVDTAERWAEYQRNGSASRQAGGKLGKCLKVETCVGEREDPRRVMSGRMEEFSNGQSKGGGRENRRAETVDPVIKIKHSAGLHSTGNLIDTACSTAVRMAYLGAHWERSHTYILITMT